MPRDVSLDAVAPHVAAEWHPMKNGSLRPDHVRSGSGRRVWWRCAHGHDWEETVNVRRRCKVGCPICSGRITTSITSLAGQAPDLAAEWHATRNAPLTPDDVRPHSNAVVWWACKRNPAHEWKAAVKNRFNGSGCAMCSGHVATRTSSLEALFPEIAKEWDVARNESSPVDVRPGSSKRVWWRCKAGHSWQAVINMRTRGTRCPICAKAEGPKRTRAGAPGGAPDA